MFDLEIPRRREACKLTQGRAWRFRWATPLDSLADAKCIAAKASSTGPCRFLVFNGGGELLQQAMNPAGLKSGNMGFEAVVAAVEMASLYRSRPVKKLAERIVAGRKHSCLRGDHR